MRYKIPYVFSLVLVAVLGAGLLSCSKGATEPEGPGAGSGTTPLAFSPMAGWPVVAQSGTRGLVTSAQELQSYDISLLSAAVLAGNTYGIFNNDVLTYSTTAGEWGYENIRYWIPEAKYTFGAFAPYASTTSSGGKNISNGTVSNSGSATDPSITITDYITGKTNSFDARSEDLLYASYTRDNTYTSDYSAVPLQFNHLLACVSFYIRNTTDTDITHIDGIELVGHQYKCNIINVGISSAVLTPDSEVVDSGENYFDGEDRDGTAEVPFLPKAMTEEQFKSLFDCENLTVLPQTVFGKGVQLKFTIHYSNSSEFVVYTGNLGSIESIPAWEQGKKYRYNITISSENIYFQLVEVPWIEHEIEL